MVLKVDCKSCKRIGSIRHKAVQNSHVKLMHDSLAQLKRKAFTSDGSALTISSYSFTEHPI